MSTCRRCPVCSSRWIRKMWPIHASRLGRDLDLFVCLRCESFFNPSGYLEAYQPRATALNWHLRVRERNERFASDLLACLMGLNVTLRSVLEIGCGIGTLLAVAQSRGLKAVGYDTNYHLTEYGREHWGLSLFGEAWRASSTEGFDLICCISTLEHQEEPRELFSELVQGARKGGGLLYIVLPFVTCSQWRYLLRRSLQDREQSPFRSDRVHGHVTHFSHKGFLKMARSMGVQGMVRTVVPGWSGYLLDFRSARLGVHLRPREDWIHSGWGRKLELYRAILRGRPGP